MKRYILTGAPGAGKTSIIRALEVRGYPIIDEAATDIIALQQARGIAEPWRRADFVDAIVNLQKQRQTQTSALPFSIQFHDRSAICSYALTKYLGQAPSPALLQEIDRLERERTFQKDVFFIENLGFCEPTAARRISFADSLVFEQLHAETYFSFGFTLIRIGRNSTKERANEILRRTGNASQNRADSIYKLANTYRR